MSNILRISYLYCHCFVQICKSLWSHDARGNDNTVGYLSEILSLIFVTINRNLLFIQNTQTDKKYIF